MNKYVEELASFKRELNIKSFDLAGHCYGGMIALKYAVRYNENLNPLILISTTASSKYDGGRSEWEKIHPGYQNMIKAFNDIGKQELIAEERLKAQIKNYFRYRQYDSMIN
ncbi:MAG: alpha/beta hydrolase [Bacteroidales bacterium]|nr:alpha/beta hydrolase [Bacteroidales bacterium]